MVGAGADSPVGWVTPEPPKPQLGALPTVSGTARVGDTLACSQGTWSNNPARFTYQWDLDGVPIPGAARRSYLVTSADQGHTLTCTVTASNLAGSAKATSAGVLIPIANVSLCPKPSGRLSGARLGPVWLGLSRSQARRKLPRFRIYTRHTDNFCLAGGRGIRVGYATPQLLAKLPGHPMVTGIILALTANPHFTVHSIRPGMRLAAAVARLSIDKAIRLDRNWWYMSPGQDANLILKTWHGVVQEIGDRKQAARPHQIGPSPAARPLLSRRPGTQMRCLGAHCAVITGSP
jgi:hypothetical protein